MLLWTTQRGLRGLVLGLLMGLPGGVALAQAPPASDPNAPPPPAPAEQATPQPQPPPDSQQAEALEKLRKLGEELQRREEEKQRAQQASGIRPDPTVPRRRPPRAEPRPGGPTTSAPAGATPRVTPPPATPPAAASQPSLQELQARARASTQRAAAQPAPGPTATQEVGPEFIGPPISLVNPPPGVTQTPESAPPPPPVMPLTEAPAEPPSESPAPPTAEAQPREPKPDDGIEWFNFDKTPWEDVIAFFVQKIGKPLLGDVIIGGDLTYKNPRRFTKDEALDELNLIMHEKGYRFVEEEHHIYIVPLSEMPQKVEMQRIYQTVEAFERDNPRDMDYVAVYYQVKDRPAAAYVDMFGDALPDYARLTPLAESNQIKIVALARDVRKFLTLKGRINIDPTDPRVTKMIAINTNAVDIEQRVRSFLKIGSGPGQPQVQLIRNQKTGAMEPRTTGGGSVEGEVLMVADERTNSIIVKATEAKVKEIEDIIRSLDSKPDIGKFETQVIEVLHGDAVQIANLLNQIFQQEQGQQQGTPNWQQQQQIQAQIRARAMQQQQQRGQQPGQPPQQGQPVQMQYQPGAAPESILVEGAFERAKKTIRLVADQRMNALIVYANEEGQARVRKMLEVLDKPQSENFQTFTLLHAKVGEIGPVLTQIVSGMTAAATRSGRGGPNIVTDELNNVFYVIAERDDMERIGQLIEQLDVEGQELVRHIVELKKLRPSDVAQMVQMLLKSGGGSGVTPTPQGMRAGRGPAVAAAPRVSGSQTEGFQVIPLDSAQTLIVLCSEEDWARVEQTINMWDEKAITNSPRLETFTLTKGNSQAVAGTLSNFYRTYQHPVLGQSPVAIQAEGDKVLVWAIEPAIEEIGALIQQLDVESPVDKVEILPLVNADAAAVAQQLQSMFISRGGAGPRGGGVSGPMIQAEPITNSLLVQADTNDMEKIKNFAMEMDQRIGKQATEQRFYPIRYATPQDVANAVQNIFGTAKAGGRGGAAAAQVRAMAAGDQVIIEAPKEKFTAIEPFIKQLDDPKGNEIVVKKFTLTGSDVTQVATNLTTAVRSIQRPGRPQATVIPDPSSETIVITATTDMMPKIEDLAKTFMAGSEGAAPERRFYPINIADAAYVAEVLQKQLPAQIAATRGQAAAGRISISVDARQNQVIIYGPKSIFAVADEMIASLDKAPVDEYEPVSIELKHADPAQVVQMITALYGQQRGAQGASRTQDVKALVSNGMLIVQGPKKKVEEVRELVAQIDSPDQSGLTIKTYPLKVLNATQVAAQVQLYLKSLGPVQRSGQMQPGAFPEPTTNTLVVIAPAEQLPFIEGLVNQFESAPRPESGAQSYVLKNARAEQVAQSIDAMLKAKVLDREGPARKDRIQTAVLSDAASNRLFIFAPEEYQKLAADLIHMVDEEVASGDIVHIIPLENGDAQQVAQTLGTVMQGKAGAGGKGAAASVRISADTGSNSILLAGLPKDLAEIEQYLKELDVNSVRVPEMQTFRLAYATTTKVEDALKAIFGGSKSPQDTVTVSSDSYSGELVVVANKRKMRHVEQIIKQLDLAPDPNEEGLLPGGRELHFVDVFRGKASDIAWDIRDLLPDEKDGGPSIESDWFDQYLIVKCRPSEFPNVEKLIREFDARIKPESKVIVYKPRDLQRILPYLEARSESENFKIEKASAERKLESMVEEVRPEGDEPPSPRDKPSKSEPEKPEKKERRTSGASARITPFQSGLTLSELLLDDVEADVIGARPPTAPRTARPARVAQDAAPTVRLAAFTAQTEKDDPGQPPADKRPVSPPAPPGRAPAGADDKKPPAPRGDRRFGPDERRGETQPVTEREPARVFVQEDGSVIITGPKDAVDDVKKTIDLLEEDLTVGEVIRIFHFKYGDVSAAAEVLSMMFDVQQRQIVIQQPQQQQQRGQGQQAGQPGQPGQPGRPGEDVRTQQGGGIMEQLRGMVGGQQQQQQASGKGGGRMRLVPDPGHNYLIVKCDEANLPEIRKLLRELDIPPGEVQIKIFQLKNLAAEETAQNISDVLGISKAQQRRTGSRAGQTQRQGMPGQPQQQQQQLIEMLQQQLVSVPGVEGGAKVERVEIVPNGVTNSLLVSAPPEVMTLIEKVIRDLEDLQGPDVVEIHYYPLENAQVDDIAPLLQEIFSSATSGGGGGGAAGPGAQRAGRGSSSSPAALGPVTISSDPRTNTIIYTAQAKDSETVEKQIQRLDIKGAVADVEYYTCKNGDAEAIASAVEALYGPGGASAAAGGRSRRGTESSGTDVRIVAEPATNTILVWGPLDKRDQIFKKIQELDNLSDQKIREIPVKNADPEKLAEILAGVFGGSGGGQSATARPAGRRGRAGAAGGGSAVQSSGRVTIVGNKAAMKLLVRAPREIFDQIEELATTLDVPSSDMRLKRFQLRYADAEGVVESVKAALTEYMSLVTKVGGEADFDAFTAMPDTRTNSVLVVGSEKTFLFVSQVLAGIDVETPDNQKKEFRTFVLEKADAVTVADAINSFAAGGGVAGTGQRSGRRGGGGMSGAAAGATRELNVTAIAEETSNSVMVIGRKDDIDTVEDVIIAELEQSLTDRYQIVTIPVENVPPSEIVSYISQFMIETGGAAGGTQRGGKQAEQAGPQMVPNDNAKTLVMRGTKRQIDEVRNLIDQFDDKTLVQPTIKVIEVPLGQDVRTLASEVQNVVNQNEEQLAVKTGRQARRVVVEANEYTNALIAAGDPQLFGQVEMIVKQLGEVHIGKYVTRVIELKNLSAQDAEQVISNLQKKGGSRSGSGSSVRPTSSGSRSTTPSPSPSIQRPSSGRQSTPSVRPAQPSGGSRSTPTQRPPTGGGGGGGGRQAPSSGGGAMLDKPAGKPDHAFAFGPVAWVEPYILTGPFTPVISLLLAQDAADDDRPARTEKQPPARSRRGEPATKPGVMPTSLREDVLKAAEEELAGSQPTSAPSMVIEERMSGVSGALRGDVTANALDSQRIVVTGDQEDIDFIEHILTMMEQTAPMPEVEVFALEEAKAASLATIIDKSVQAWIAARTSRPGPAEKFSINAEARSNSLIVSASAPIMDKIAELVERLDVKKGGTGLDLKVVPVLHIRASEAAAILRPTIEKLNTMRDVAKDQQAYIEGVDRDNTIQIIGTPKDIQEIEGWLKSIDVELTTEQKQSSFVTADAIVIQLKNGSAEDIAKVLNDMIKAEQEAAIAGSTGDKKTPGKQYVKKIKLRLLDGRELPELNLERPIKLVAEKGTNSLIIFSTKDNNEALTAIVDLFDTLPIGADTDVKAFALRHASSETIAKLIEDIFKDKSPLNRPSEGDAKSLPKGQMPPIPPGMAAKGLPYPLVVQHDVRSNTVIIIGRKDAVLLAGGLITELDRPTTDLGVKSYVLQLKSAQAAQLTEKLKKIMDDRVKALGGDKGAARDNAVIQPDERSNKLIVLATEEVYDMIEELVLQLDASDKYSIVDARYRPLKQADAVKLKNMLEDAFKSMKEADGKLNKDSADTLSLLADTRSNSLLLTGTHDYLEKADKLIAELDQKFDPTVVFKSRKVKLNSAPNIASLLKEMIEKALTQKDSKLSGTAIHVVADPVSDTLLMAAARDDMDVLERWVEILDRPSEVGRMVKIIPLRRLVAEDASKAVQDIFKSKSGSGQTGGQIDVSVSADKTTNSVVAFGPPVLIKDVEDFLLQLDVTEATKSTVVRIFKLEQAAAQDAGDLLTRILDLRSGSVGGTSSGGSSGTTQKDTEKQVMLVFQKQHPELGAETLKAIRTDVVVISDVRTNSLVIAAPPESMALMESLVTAVDVPPQDAKVRVFRLRNSDAEQMVKMLEALFQQKNTASTSSRSGTSGQSERVLTIEGMGGEGGRQEVAFTTDVRTNSVIAAGTPGYLDLAERTILELDTIPINDRETFVYAPRNIKADKLVPSLKDFSDAEQKRLEDIGQDVSVGVKQERQITAIANEDANRVIVSVDPRFREAVMNVIRDLDQAPPQVMIQVLILEITMENSLELGVEFAFQDLNYAKAGASDTTTFDYVGGTDIGASGSGLGGFTFTITGADFNFLLRTLQSESNLQVLSRPQIVAMDNQEALIDISNDVPYVTGTATSTGGVTSTSVARQKVGIQLTVTPQINPDGYVRMEVDQKVDDFTNSTVSVGPGVTAPIFFTREAKTVVSVKDNETVVLGGLITSRVENKETKVPLIGDIPGLGMLFRYQVDSTKRTELLVVLTPHVVRTPEDYREISIAERDSTQLVPSELLGDALMQGLRASPAEVPVENGSSLPAAPGENLFEPGLTPDDDEYGPSRPTLRAEPVPNADPNSYDVPLSFRSPRR